MIPFASVITRRLLMPDAMRGRAVTPAYIQTNALARGCPNCEAVVGEFCVFPDGSERHVPCVGRMGEAS
jgi:hypothetical protein